MHELTITQSIVDISLKAANERGAHRIRTIKICYGPFSGINPECIRMYLGIVARDTIADNARLETVVLPIVIRCRTCGATNNITRTHIACPCCGGIDVEILSGRDFYVDSLEVD